MIVEHLSYSYKPDQPLILQDIHFSLPESFFLVVLGPSGSGKSTLLRLLSGLNQPTSGSIKLNLSANSKMSFVFQEPRLVPWRTIEENLKLPIELSNGKISDDLILSVLKKVNLKPETKALFPAELSGGMKMRVSLARALLTGPELIFFDEPFAALDEVNRIKLTSDLAGLYKDRSCRKMIYVTHNFTEAAFLATHVLIISKSGTVQSFTGLNKDPSISSDGSENSAELKKTIELLRLGFMAGQT